MAAYKLIEVATGKIYNIVEWDGVSSYDTNIGYALELVTESFDIDWDGGYNGLYTSASMVYSGDFVGNFYGNIFGSSSYALNFNIDNLDHINFDTASLTPVTEGTFVWNDGDGTLDLGLKGGNVTLQVGQQEYAMAFNAEITQSLVKGDVVYISGSQGNRIAVKKASAIAEEGSRNTLGIVAENILVGNEGLILLSGVLHGLNTSGSNAGATLFLDTVAGKYTETRPLAPNHTVIVGFVQRVHQSQGSIFVKIDNGYEIDELHNISIDNVQSGDLLVRSGSIWTNTKQLTGSYDIDGSLNVIGTLTGELIGTSSYASTASYVEGMKAGIVLSGSANLVGEIIYNVTFSNHYTNTNYAVTVTATDTARIWTIENKETGSFTINSNSNIPSVGGIYWIAIPFNS